MEGGVIALITNQQPAPEPTVVVDPEKATVPYLIGASGQLNPPVPIMADNVTLDGTVRHDLAGSFVHPSVLDFHALTASGEFGGHRYWMANSEYSHHGDEDTMILCSDDAYTWRQPEGAAPGVQWTINDQPPVLPGSINTDPELVYDPDADELVVLWRQDVTPGRLWHSKSSDGVTWTAPLLAMEQDRMTFISPCVVPDGSGGWVMICWGNSAPTRRTAPALTGPWSTPTPITGTQEAWHGGVWRDPDDGTLYAAASSPQGDVTCFRSSDGGFTWTRTVLVAVGFNPAGGWEVKAIYRPTIQPHPNGTHMRLWYSTNGLPGPDNRTGYTILPRSLWDT